MRDDEEYVKLAMEKYMKNNIEEVTIIDGDEPPDYYVLFQNKKILLEVTRAESIYLSDKLQTRNTIEQSIIKLCNQLNNDIGIEINENKSLLLDIKGPLTNYDKFKKSIKDSILSFLNDGINYSLSLTDWVEINIFGNIIKVKIVKSSPLKKRIIGIIGIKNNLSITNIGEQALLILEDRIKIKEGKTKIINGVLWKEEKWLAIFNNYWLASADTYIRAMKQIKIHHTFTRIFLISDNYEVTQVY